MGELCDDPDEVDYSSAYTDFPPSVPNSLLGTSVLHAKSDPDHGIAIRDVYTKEELDVKGHSRKVIALSCGKKPDAAGHVLCVSVDDQGNVLFWHAGNVLFMTDSPTSPSTHVASS